MLHFDSPREELFAHLGTEADGLDFGVIGLNAATWAVELYNRRESEMAGLSPERVMGRHMFEEVAPCMNNFMVAQRFQDETDLDARLDYVLTLKMRPTRVVLRLLKRPGDVRAWLLLKR